MMDSQMRMAETKITERIISGTGLLRLPPSESAVRYYSVLVDVIRIPRVFSPSFRYNPYRQRFATMVVMRDGYVIDEMPVDYANRRFDWLINEPGQVLIALKCSHGQVLQQLAGTGGTPALSNIDSFNNLSMMWSELRFVCHDTTAIKVSLYQDTYDQCGDTYREKSPPPPPPPPPPNTTNTPIQDISPPYDEDDDITSKSPLDEYFTPEPPEFPQGDRCSGYRVNYSVRDTNGADLSGYQDHFGEIEFVGQDPSNPNRLLITSHGQIVTPGSPCLPNPVGYGASSSSAGLNMSTFSYSIVPL